MYLDTAKATLIFKGIENSKLQPVVLNIMEKTSKVKENANRNFNTIEAVILYVVMPFYERKNEVEGIYSRIEEEKVNNNDTIIEILTSKADKLKAKTIDYANEFLDFNFVNVSKNPVLGQNLVSMIDLLDIQDNKISINLFSKIYADYVTQEITLGEVVFDCFDTKKTFENDLANKNMMPEINEQESKTNSKLTEDMSAYFLAR